MKKWKVLVTGVGGIMGYGIIRSLRSSKFDVTVIGMDIYNDAVGASWSDVFIPGVLAASPEFIPFVTGLIERHEIDLVIPGIEHDLIALSQGLPNLPTRAKYVLCNRDVLGTLLDKWQTAQLQLNAGLKCIPTRLISDLCQEFSPSTSSLQSAATWESKAFNQLSQEFGLPFILKPIRSSASKAICKVESLTTLIAHIVDNPQHSFIAQQLMLGEEVTASVFGLGDGSYCNAIAHSRTLSREGSTQKARWRPSVDLRESLNTLCRLVKPEGPTNFQYIIREGTPYLLEINPRISSASSIRTLCGVNEPEMCIEYYLCEQVPHERTQTRLDCVRYIEDLIISGVQH